MPMTTVRSIAKVHRALVSWCAPFLGIILTAAPLPAEDPAPPAAASEGGDRLEFMKKSVVGYEVKGDDGTAFELVPEPLLRWDNPVSKVPDGTIFLWQDAHARPAAIVQVFIAGGTKDLWLHEFQSLRSTPFEVKLGTTSIWNPRRGGVKLQPLEGAPVPAGTKPGRLVQMRQLAKRFTAQDEFEDNGRWELRLLATPLHRYDGHAEVLDGAIFAFAHGTDPEALLLLEARKDGDSAAWHYALAPMTGYALRMSDQGKDVWSIAARKAPYDRKEPFICIPIPEAEKP